MKQFNNMKRPIFNILKKFINYFTINTIGGYCNEKDDIIDKIKLKDKTINEIEKIIKGLRNDTNIR